MSSLLVINADGPETRVALVEDGLLGELYIERKRERGIAGNIYKGRVERVLPGMQAAFVNIGAREVGVPARLGRARHARRPQALARRRRESQTRGRGRADRSARAAARASRTFSRKARRSSSRSPRSRSAPRARAPRGTSRCPDAIWCSCRPSSTSASRAASRPTRSAAACATSSSRCARPARASSSARSPRACSEKDLQVGHGVPDQAVERGREADRIGPLPVA